MTTTREARARGLSHFAGLLESLSDEDDSFFFLDFFVSFFSFFFGPSHFPFSFSFSFLSLFPALGLGLGAAAAGFTCAAKYAT